MTPQEEIEKLERDIARLKGVIARCDHIFGEPYQAYETKQVPEYGNEPRGSDFFNPVLMGFRTERTMVWKRRCPTCGLTQTTTKTEPVVERHRPVF